MAELGRRLGLGDLDRFVCPEEAYQEAEDLQDPPRLRSRLIRVVGPARTYPRTFFGLVWPGRPLADGEREQGALGAAIAELTDQLSLSSCAPLRGR